MRTHTRHAAHGRLSSLTVVIVSVATLVLLAGIGGDVGTPATALAGTGAIANDEQSDEDWVKAVIVQIAVSPSQSPFREEYLDTYLTNEDYTQLELFEGCLLRRLREGEGRIDAVSACVLKYDPIGQLTDAPPGGSVDLSWGPDIVDRLNVFLVTRVTPDLFSKYANKLPEQSVLATVLETATGEQAQRCVLALGLLGIAPDKVQELCLEMLRREVTRALDAMLPPAQPPTDVTPPMMGTVPTMMLPMMQVPPPPPPPPTPRPTATPTPTPRACNLSGRWSGSTANWGGRWDLTQQGTSVTGTFPGSSPSYAGEVRGTITGNRFVGTWRWTGVQSSRGQGEFEYTISDDCRRLTGRMRIGSSGAWFNDSLQRQ